MKPLTILIVDDEEAACENLADILELSGHEVTWSSSPAQACLLQESHKGRFDLAILDLKMPEMNGVQLLQKLRQRQPDLAAILTTAYGDQAEFSEEDRELFEDVISKPVDVRLLLERVQKKKFPLVICVDDDREYCDNLAEILANHRIDCECFHDFDSASQRLAQKVIDVALLDIRIPGTGGLDAARKLKLANPEITNILITGYPSDIPSPFESVSDLGIHCVIEKPLKPDQLLDSIANIRRQAN